MPSQTYGTTVSTIMSNKLRCGKVERLEYFGRTANAVAGEIFIDGKSAALQRLVIPLNTTVYIELFGVAKDSAGTPVNDAFSGKYRVHRQASGAAVLTAAAVPLLSAADGTTAYAKLVAAVAGTSSDEIRFTYTGAASSGVNVVRFRLNVVSVSTDADTLAM